MISTILRNITSNWAALLLNTLISFILAPIVVNGLGSVYYGIWTLLTQFTGYLWLMDFGVRESVIKYVAQYHASGEDRLLQATIRTAISVYSLVTVLALAAVAGLSWGLPYLFNIPAEAVPAARIAAFFTGASVAQSFLSNVFVGVLMGLQRFYAVARIGMLFAVVRGVVTFALLTGGYGIVALAALHLVLSVVMGLVTFRLCQTALPGIAMSPTRLERVEVAKLLNYGKYVILSNLGDKIVFATDALVIGAFLPIAALTPYAIAGTLIAQMRGVIMAMASVFNPLTSSVESRDGSASVGTIVVAGSKAAMIVGLPLCVGFITLGETFVRLWMGPTYSGEAATILSLLAAGYIVGLPYHTISGVLYGLGRHRLVAWLRIVEGALNLGLSIVLVQRIGLTGVAIGTLIPHVIIVGFVLPASLPRQFPISLGQYYATVYVRPLLAALPFFVATFLIASWMHPASLVSFFGSGLISLVVYIVPIWFIALAPAERRRLVDAAGKRLPLPRRLRECRA